MEMPLKIQDNSNWSNAGGCAILHPFNKEKQAECEKGSAKNLSAQADLLLAQAALEKSKQPQQQSGWSATQTTMVVIGSVLALTLMIVIIKKIRSKKS